MHNSSSAILRAAPGGDIVRGVLLFCIVLYGVVLITLEQACEVCQRIFRPVCASDGVIIIIIIIIIALNDHNKNADRQPTRTSARSVLKLVNTR